MALVEFKLVLALIFATCASMCSAFGLILMKVGIIKDEGSTKQSKYSYLFKIWWISGLLFLACGQVFNCSKYINLILFEIYTCILLPDINRNLKLIFYLNYSGIKIRECNAYVIDICIHNYLHSNIVTIDSW